MKKLLTSAICSLLLSHAAQAYSFLCIEDNSVGFHDVGGKWEPENFETKKYIIKALTKDDPSAQVCWSAIAFAGNPTENTELSTGSEYRYGCFNIGEVGEEPVPTSCRIVVRNGIDSTFICNGLTEYSFAADGEFVRLTRYPAPMTKDLIMQGRDSMVMAMGTCTKID